MRLNRSRSRLAGAALALTLLGALAGCGGNKIDAYCSDLTAHQKEMSDMIDSTSPSALLAHLPMLHQLAGKAPDDLVDQWHTFVSALDDLEAAIKHAGVKPSDFEDGKPPAGLSAADREAIAQAANQVQDPDVVAAASGIEQEGRDVCKVNLGV